VEERQADFPAPLIGTLCWGEGGGREGGIDYLKYLLDKYCDRKPITQSISNDRSHRSASGGLKDFNQKNIRE